VLNSLSRSIYPALLATNALYLESKALVIVTEASDLQFGALDLYFRTSDLSSRTLGVATKTLEERSEALVVTPKETKPPTLRISVNTINLKVLSITLDSKPPGENHGGKNSDRPLNPQIRPTPSTSSLDTV
jgi:hypothetical protein